MGCVWWGEISKVARGYLTPDSIPTAKTRRWICFPNEPYIVMAVNGALLELTHQYNWFSYGVIEPDEIAQALVQPVLDFMATESLCMPILHEPIYIQDQKSQNTNGGTATLGSWQQRNLNTKQGDTFSLVTLASNRFTLPIGRWNIKWSAPAHNVQRHQSLLYSVTGAIGIAFGTSEFTNSVSPTQSRSIGMVVLDVSTPTQFEIQHRVQATVANIGYGVPANFGTEIYTTVELNLIS